MTSADGLLNGADATRYAMVCIGEKFLQCTILRYRALHEHIQSYLVQMPVGAGWYRKRLAQYGSHRLLSA